MASTKDSRVSYNTASPNANSVLTPCKNILTNKENKDCFQPHINPTTYQPTLQVSLRLYSNDPRERHELAAAANKSKKEEEEKAYPFHPQIHSTKARSKCFNLSKTTNEYKKQPTKNFQISTQCSFRPLTGAKRLKSENLSCYLNRNPFDRLTSADAPLFTTRPRDASNNSIQLTNKFAASEHQTKSHRNTCKSQAYASFDFYDRMIIYQHQKEIKKEKIQKEADKELTYSPSINMKIEVSAVPHTERLSRFMNLQTACTFRPEINSTKHTKSKSPEEMISCPLKKKESDIMKIKGRIEAEEKKTFTFSPKISDKGVKSKLDIQDPDYLHKYNKFLEKKDSMRLSNLKEKERAELKECTHKPQINKGVAHCQPKIVGIKKSYAEIHGKKAH